MGRSTIRRTIIGTCFWCFLCAPLSAQTPAEVQRPRVALVLEGGAALGLAHVGVIKIIEELGIPIDIVVGTSMGATVGGFYAEGYDAASLEAIALGIDWISTFSEAVNSSEESFRDRIDRSQYFAKLEFDARGFKIPGRLLSGRKMLYLLDRSNLSQPSPVDFDTLPRRYRAVTVDLATGDRVVLEQGSLSDAMRASMGIPGIFAPYLINGRYLIDGGTIDNLPIGVARDLGADLIIAVDLIGGTPFSPEEFDRNPIDALNRTMMIMLRDNVKAQLPDADLVITVDLLGYQPTDFAKAAQIIAQGEKAARELRSELESLKARLGTLLPEDTAISPKAQLPIQQVIVEGGSEKDRARVHALLKPIYGVSPKMAAVQLDKAIAVLEESGIYDSIRFNRTADESNPTLVVSLKRRKKPGQSVRLGLEYASTYAGTTVGGLSLMPSVVFRGFTTDDSRLAIDMRILDSPALDVSFIQPIGGPLFVEGVFHANQNTETYSNESDVDYLYQSRTLGIGINVGVNPTRWSEGSIGFSYEWMESDPTPIIHAGEAIGSAPMVHALFVIHNFDSPVFPTSGLAVKLRYDQSLPGPGGTGVFHNLMTDGIYIPSLGIPFSFSAFWKAGSDFSAVADEAGAAPLNYKPDLADSHFFLGPLEAEERVGSHVAGIGGAIKYQINWASNAIGVPAFLLVQTAAGVVLQDIADIDRLSDFTHWGVTLGVGARLNDGFGVAFRVGMLRGFNRSYRPFVAFNLGSIGY